MGVSQVQSRRKESPLWPAGHIYFDAAQNSFSFLICKYMLCWGSHQPTVVSPSLRAALYPFLDQCVFVFRIAQAQVQDFLLSLFEIPVVPIGHSQASQFLWKASLPFSVLVSWANFPKAYSIPLPMSPIKVLNGTIPILAIWGTPLVSIWISSHWTRLKVQLHSQFLVHWVVYLPNPRLSNLENKCYVGQCQTLRANTYSLLTFPSFSSMIYP